MIKKINHELIVQNQKFIEKLVSVGRCPFLDCASLVSSVHSGRSSGPECGIPAGRQSRSLQYYFLVLQFSCICEHPCKPMSISSKQHTIRSTIVVYLHHIKGMCMKGVPFPINTLRGVLWPYQEGTIGLCGEQ